MGFSFFLVFTYTKSTFILNFLLFILNLLIFKESIEFKKGTSKRI